jgi:hypothetical protein
MLLRRSASSNGGTGYPSERSPSDCLSRRRQVAAEFEARRVKRHAVCTLVAPNATGASDGRDKALFDGREDDTKTPSEGPIDSEIEGPTTMITRI